MGVLLEEVLAAENGLGLLPGRNVRIPDISRPGKVNPRTFSRDFPARSGQTPSAGKSPPDKRSGHFLLISPKKSSAAETS